MQALLDREKKQLSDKLEGNKRKLTEAMDEAMRHKLESGREQALAKQQVRAVFSALLGRVPEQEDRGAAAAMR